MANIKFMWQSLEDATLTATSTDSGFPLTNLQNRNPALVWKSDVDTATQYLNIDFGSSRSCDTCIVDGTNFGDISATYIVLQYSSDAAFTSPTQAGSFSVSSSSAEKLEFTAASFRYWRIKFFDTIPFGIYPKIGNIFLGTRVEMTQPYDTGIEKSSGFSTSQTRAIDGTRYTSQLYNGLKKYKIKFTNINETDKTSINTLFEGIRGSYFPFYFVDADSTIVLVYSVNDENPLQTKAYQIYDTAEVNLEAYSVNT